MGGHKMGNVRRLKKQLSQPLALADSKIAFNHCKVFLANPDPIKAKKAAGQFAKFMAFLNDRAQVVNIRDLYTAHFQVLKKIEAGEPLIEEDLN